MMPDLCVKASRTCLHALVLDVQNCSYWSASLLPIASALCLDIYQTNSAGQSLASRQLCCLPPEEALTCFWVRTFPMPKCVSHDILSDSQSSFLHEPLDVLASLHISFSEDQACDPWPDRVAVGCQMIKLQSCKRTLAELLHDSNDQVWQDVTCTFPGQHASIAGSIEIDSGSHNNAVM